MTVKANSYSIHIDSKISPKLNTFIRSGKYSSFFIICDSNTLNYCLSELVTSCPVLKQAEIIELEPGEESKDIGVVNNIWQTLTENGADKKSLIIHLGGGVVSDTGGFAASTFKRGVDFINVPTTLLSIADASIGGKTGINFAGIKNHIGTIINPAAVFINTSFLKTLPENHIISGFAEIIKMALILDNAFFKQLEHLVIKDSFNHLSIIKRAIDLKNKVVKKDPHEKGFRKILNFGHTVGHAVESLSYKSGNPLLHGDAVAIGIAVESYLSFLMKRITFSELTRIVNSLALNFEFPAIKDPDSFMVFFNQDKKHKNNTYHLALLKGIGKCDFDVRVSNPRLLRALRFYNEEIANATYL